MCCASPNNQTVAAVGLQDRPLKAARCRRLSSDDPSCFVSSARAADWAPMQLTNKRQPPWPPYPLAFGQRAAGLSYKRCSVPRERGSTAQRHGSLGDPLPVPVGSYQSARHRRWPEMTQSKLNQQRRSAWLRYAFTNWIPDTGFGDAPLTVLLTGPSRFSPSHCQFSSDRHRRQRAAGQNKPHGCDTA
jgi:hypothetical protein